MAPVAGWKWVQEVCSSEGCYDLALPMVGGREGALEVMVGDAWEDD